MIIKSLELKDFRNYETLELKLDKGINIFYGDNAQGKTNILDAVYTGCTSKSQRAAKDRELIRFGSDEAHIKLVILKNDINYRIDMHIKKTRAKGIAVNKVPIRRASELFGIANVIFFAPGDLNIVKNGPSERRRFMDSELCQLDKVYLHDLISFNRVVNQKNKLLKDMELVRDFDSFLDVYNEQLVKYGSEIINIRAEFINKLNQVISRIHGDITAGSERLELKYEPDVEAADFKDELKRRRPQEIKNRMSLAGPHRDDVSFIINGVDIRSYGSQGQQRSSVLSLKLAELNIVEMSTGEKPIMLLDDVLSELDVKRQDMFLKSLSGCQTLITCTGLDDFVDKRFHIDKVFRVNDGKVTGVN